ncbi:zinc finger protein 106-like [Astyanax mexicanus]|uniref:Zinc finger protein 106 n=1 Tax=Astyanax mexicanus TaxID=7994 RepID=A0A8B9LA99_ASTMX|nr:zinc finger protein 106-like [Astyanax mexicanus]
MKTRQLQKCPVCLLQYQNKNLDKHMHSRSHHEAIEKLKGSPQIHKCLACGISVWGMSQYEKHIMTPGHITNLIYLQKNRWSGRRFTVDYTDDELAAVCAERDQKRLALKLKKKKEQQQRRMARKKIKKKIKANNNQITQSNSQSSNKTPPLNKEDTHESNQTVDCTDHFYSNRQSNLCCPPLHLIFISEEEDDDCSQQRGSAMKEQILDANPPDSSPVTRPLLSDVPTVDLKTDISSQHSNKSMTQDTASEKPTQSLHASGLDHRHVNSCLSTTPKSMSPSVQKDQVLFICTSASSDFSAADRVMELKKSTDEPRSKHAEKFAKEKTPPFTLQKPCLGYKTPEGCSSEQWRKTKELEARIKEKSSPPMKPSGGYSLAAPTAGFLQECKTDQHRNQDSTQSTHNLPALLNRSATKRVASKPNLNIARGIHASQKPNKTGSASLKPALEKLINSKSSQWKVNWKEIYEEATKNKLQKEKGLPRFGIEFVSPPTPGPLELILDEVEAFDESCLWESINFNDGTPFSSVFPLSKNTCGSQPAEASPGPSSENHNDQTSVTKFTSLPMKTPLIKSKKMKSGDIKDAVKNMASLTNRTSAPVTEANALAELHESGTEQHSGSVLNPLRHTKKQDDPDSNIKNIEIPKNTLSELLALFHREEELRSYLDHVNSQLLLAQSALRASLSNVQNLQEIKQQVTTEMAMLISKNIEVLQRIQNSSLCGNVPIFGTESHQRVPDTPRVQQELS